MIDANTTGGAATATAAHRRVGNARQARSFQNRHAGIHAHERPVRVFDFDEAPLFAQLEPERAQQKQRGDGSRVSLDHGFGDLKLSGKNFLFRGRQSSLERGQPGGVGHEPRDIAMRCDRAEDGQDR